MMTKQNFTMSEKFDVDVLGNSGRYKKWKNICFWIALWQQLKRLDKLHKNAPPSAVLSQAQWGKHGRMTDINNHKHVRCILNACRHFGVCIVVFSGIYVTCGHTRKTIFVCGKQHKPFGNPSHLRVEIVLANSHYQAIQPHTPARTVEEKETSYRSSQQSCSWKGVTRHNKKSRVFRLEERKHSVHNDIYTRYLTALANYGQVNQATVENIVQNMYVIGQKERDGDMRDALQQTSIAAMEVIEKERTELMESINDAVSNMSDKMTEVVLTSLIDLIHKNTRKLYKYQ